MVEVNIKKNHICVIDYNNQEVTRFFETYQQMCEEYARICGTFTVIPIKKDNKFKNGKLIASKAEKWIGKEFNPGQTEQCCYFVRQILRECGYNIGITQKAWDDGEPSLEGYANSLAGDDIGKKISNINELEVGDLVFFQNTYGDWEEGTITHIGIYIGNGYFVHRPTVNKPVIKESLEDYGHWCCGCRLYN